MVTRILRKKALLRFTGAPFGHGERDARAGL